MRYLLILALSGQLFACGVERWAVKTLADGQADQVAGYSTDSTISQLVKIPAPSRRSLDEHTDTRFEEETDSYSVRAILIGIKLEADGDFHLVLEDPEDDSITMIAEIPSPKCAPSDSLAALWQSLRLAVVNMAGKPTAKLKAVNLPVTISGIFFFDFIHGQSGVAPNGAELHPVSAISQQ